MPRAPRDCILIYPFLTIKTIKLFGNLKIKLKMLFTIPFHDTLITHLTLTMKHFKHLYKKSPRDTDLS